MILCINCVSAVWDHVMSSHGEATALHRELIVFFSLVVYINFYVFLFMKSINIFLFGSTLCQLRKQIRPKTGKFFLTFSLFILILYLPFHEMHKHFMFGSTLCQLMEQLRP